MKELKIKIAETNREKIEAVIKEAEGKARVRTISVDDIIGALQRVAFALEIPKCHMKGIKVYGDPNAQSFLGAYTSVSCGNRPQSTQFSAEYNGKEWVLTDVWRGDCRPGSQEFSINLTDEAKEAIIRSFESGERDI